MLHDDSSFFHWLEGPAQGVERVMRSIRGDPRHTDLDVLNQRPSSARRFDGWGMKLAARGAASARWNGEILEPPPEIVENLRRRPAAAPDLLAKLVPPPAGPAALGRSTASVLKSVILEAVIPRLLHGHCLPAAKAKELRANPRAPEPPSSWSPRTRPPRLI